MDEGRGGADEAERRVGSVDLAYFPVCLHSCLLNVSVVFVWLPCPSAWSV